VIVYYKEKNVLKNFSLVIISVILLLSVIPLQSVYAPSIAFDSEINLSNNIPNSILPEIVISGSNVYVVWIDGTDIFFKKSTDTGATFPSATLDIGDEGTSTEGPPKIAVSGNNIYTIWKEGNNIKFINSTNNGVSFASAEVQVSGSTLIASQYPQVDTPGSDIVYTVWRDKTGANDEIIFKRSTDNGLNFDSAILVGTTNMLDPTYTGTKVIADGTNVYVVWQDSTDILFARSTDSGLNFGAVQDIGDSSGFTSRESLPEIVAAGSNVYVIWQQNSNIQFARNTNDGDPANWIAPITIGSSIVTTTGNTPKIATSASGGIVYAVWRDNSVGGGDIIFKTSIDSGATFGFPTTPSDGNLSDNTGLSTTPDIAVSGTNVHVVWDDSTSGNGDILYVLSTDDGVTFGNSQNVSDDTETSDQPKLAASGSSPFVVWTDSSPGEIFFRTGILSPITVSFDQTQFKLSDTATITVTDSGSSGSIVVDVKSDFTDPATIPITLTEGPTGTFTGTITFTESGSSSGTTLRASVGDTITATIGPDFGTASIFPRTIDFVNGGSTPTTFNLGAIAHPRVVDQNSNINPASAEQITITIASTTDGGGGGGGFCGVGSGTFTPSEISLTLTETGVDTGIFGGDTGSFPSDLIFSEISGLVPIASTVTICQEDSGNTENSNADSGAIDIIQVDVISTSDPTGIEVELTETDVNTGQFLGELKLSTTASDDATDTILISAGDLITITNKGSGSNFSLLLVTPTPIQNGALNAIPPALDVIATYKGATINVDVIDASSPGGGGGGLVSPGLVVNALGGLGGGGGSPSTSLNNLVTNRAVDLPEEVKQMVLNHDSYSPLLPMDLDSFGDFDFPLVISDQGFLLGGFTNTLQTQTLKTDTPVTMKFTVYTTDKVQHFSLYTNLRDTNDSIAKSDTQILYNDEKDLTIIDPQGFFSNVKITVTEEGSIKKYILVEMTFAKEMETSHIITRMWDSLLRSGDTHILDAIKVELSEPEFVPIPQETEEVQVEELTSQEIPKWVKSNAEWWVDQQIDDGSFVAGIQYLINNGIMYIPNTETVNSSVTEIPDWVKNNAEWWVDNEISDDDFVKAMEWLVTNGVITLE